jgi:polyisoprenoid-binding protein YceI
MRHTLSLALVCLLTAATDASAGGTTEYLVDTASSEVNILVYSKGALARFGHNHVMTSRSVQGRISVSRASPRVAFDLSFPVDELIVDDPQERIAAGNDFPLNLTPADRTGTRKNMLGPAVLDAQRFPFITLSSVSVSGDVQNPHFSVLVTIRDVSLETPVDAQLTLVDSRLTATGEFDIRQSDFGIEPFSVVLGALRIDDRLHVSFALIAQGPGS